MLLKQKINISSIKQKQNYFNFSIFYYKVYKINKYYILMEKCISIKQFMNENYYSIKKICLLLIQQLIELLVYKERGNDHYICIQEVI